MFKKKEGKQEQTENTKLSISPELEKALVKATGDSDSDSGESTKFTLLENLHNKDTAIFYTEFKNEQVVEQANRLKKWGELMPLVFGDSEGVKECQKQVNEHLATHYMHMASKGRKRESALVYAVKQDTAMVQTDKQIASFLGGRK